MTGGDSAEAAGIGDVELDTDCPVTATTRLLLARKWPPVIVHRLLDGPLGFNELARAVDGISAKVLSHHLDVLASAGLVERRVVSESPLRVEYALTEEGRSLRPLVTAMADWGRAHLAPAANPEESAVHVG